MPDILLKDKNGVDVTYEGVETVTFDTPTQEKGATFTYGELLEGATVPLDMADGDQVFSLPDGYLAKSGTILKPATMTPNNIRKGVDIAGVVGEVEVIETQSVEVNLSLVDGDQMLTSPSGYAYSNITIKKPNTLLESNIREGVNIAGVVGTLISGGGGGSCDFDFTDERLKYFSYYLDNDNKTVVICRVLFDTLYDTTGSYDVTIPDTLGGYNVMLRG